MSRFFFGSVARVWLSCLITQFIFQFGGHALQRFILDDCAQPGLALGLLGLWFTIGILASFATAVLLGLLFGSSSFLSEFNRDEMAEFDAKLDGKALPDTLDDDDEEAMIQELRGGSRFTFYWIISALGTITVANAMGGQFLQTFSHPGLAVIQIRSADANLRRQGIESLLMEPSETHHKTVTGVVRQTLSDTNEGVRARAIHVAGQMSLSGLIPDLEQFLTEHSVFTFSALLSVGLMTDKDPVGNTIPHADARKLMERVAVNPAVNQEPEALAYALGLLRVPAHQTLRAIYENAEDDKEKVAAVWGLASLRDRRLSGFFEAAILDDSVAVQCAAINALERLAVPESAPVLMKRFESLIQCVGEDDERTCEPLEVLDCPEIGLPVQEGGAARIVVKRRELLLAIVRALSTTQHPDLLTWLVRYQLRSETNYRTWLLMSRVYERMEDLDRKGRLTTIRQRLRQNELLKRQQKKLPSPKVYEDTEGQP